ncbi:helix-turn-helix transcriptional regulator [Streptomyces sp. ME03-5709C]|nr:helix-turn-helix transcriptional regulator [Streptomyces sp. ME03-5709C]
MSDTTRPEPPPEAALIRRALKRSRLTGRSAAARAGLSDARWRQIVSGYQSVGGSHHPVRAPAETLARMAQAVGVTAEELTTAGRPDAAAELAELERPAQSSPAAYASDPHIDAIAALLATLPPEAQDEVMRRVGRAADRKEAYGLPEGNERRAV